MKTDDPASHAHFFLRRFMEKTVEIAVGKSNDLTVTLQEGLQLTHFVNGCDK